MNISNALDVKKHRKMMLQIWGVSATGPLGNILL